MLCGLNVAAHEVPTKATHTLLSWTKERECSERLMVGDKDMMRSLVAIMGKTDLGKMKLIPMKSK